MIDIGDTLNFVLQAFLAQDASFNSSNAFRALVCLVIISTLGAFGSLAAPFPKMAHAEAAKALRGAGFEVFGMMKIVVEEKA